MICISLNLTVLQVQFSFFFVMTMLCLLSGQVKAQKTLAKGEEKNMFQLKIPLTVLVISPHKWLEIVKGIDIVNSKVTFVQKPWGANEFIFLFCFLCV